jgi:hypothetical protein
MRPDVLAEHLGQTIRGLLGPMTLRVAELEASGRSAIATVDASLGDLGARVAQLEARAPVPGPEGPPGPPGPAGLDGKDGKDGAAWTYLGTHVAGKTYDAGDLVTDHGSLFYCTRMTTGRPGASQDWKLMVKRGQDGKDAR